MYYKVCEICDLKSGRISEQKRPFLAKFPLDEERCKKWVIVTGKESLAYMPIKKLHMIKYVCGKHFTARDFHKNNKSRLKRTAVPSQHLTRPPLDEEWLDFFPYQETTNIDARRKVYDYMNITYSAADQEIHTNMECTNSTDPVDDNTKQSDHKDSDENDVGCTEVEYLEEDAVFEGLDDNPNDNTPTNNIIHEDHAYLKQKDTDAPRRMKFEQDFKLTLDDVDYLFLSYAKTLRSLDKQCQIMLKLDIAKLFARYEMKSSSLINQEESKSVEHPQPPIQPAPITMQTPPLALKPSPPNVNPPPEKPSIFVPSKEDNKRIFRRVPLQALIAGINKAGFQSRSQVIIESPKIIRETLQDKQQIPQDLPSPSNIRQTLQVIGPQIILPQISTTQKYNIPRTLDPTVKLERLKLNPTLQLPPKLQSPTKIKYYVPPKGPAYAIISKESVKSQKSLNVPDLETEVSSEPVHTETVFVTTDNVNLNDVKA